MPIGRRTLLKLIGGVGVAATGYAGYQEMTDGRWLYDPAQLTAARTKFFGIVDYATLYKVAEEYSDADVDDEVSSFADPDEIETIAMVGSSSISGDNGVPTSVFTAAMDGSFDVGEITDAAEEMDDVSEERGDDNRFNGYRLWELSIPDEGSSAFSELASSDGADALAETAARYSHNEDEETERPEDDEPEIPADGPSMPSSLPESAALATKEGGLVGGLVRAPEADKITSMKAVKTMIRSKRNGGGVTGPDLLTADGDYESIRSQFDSDPTFLFGAMLDPAMVTLSTAVTEIALGFVGGAVPAAGDGTADAVSVMMEAWVEDLRAGAIGGTINTDETGSGDEQGKTTMKTFLTYSTADAAKQTGIVQLVNAAGNSADMDGFDEVKARYEGKSIVVTVKGDTEKLFEESTEAATEVGTPTELDRA